ncbi:YcgL domain-containing protein [Marinospirillum sp. MEB164]|uniref:YcgL domain-containing protein V6U78_02335 n=1 Tax=Marinospirillum alkalitolerans TaxID=3123374 RepID=A0ABW8PV71_9GAMM
MVQLTEIYASPRRDELYLYVDAKRGLSCVPADLLAQFGTPRKALTLVLEKHKKLARADYEEVRQQLKLKGYYLQLPPAKEAYLLDLYRAPTEARY